MTQERIEELNERYRSEAREQRYNETHCKRCGNEFEYDELYENHCLECMEKIIKKSTFEERLNYLKNNNELIAYFIHTFEDEEKNDLIYNAIKTSYEKDKKENDTLLEFINEQWEYDFFKDIIERKERLC